MKGRALRRALETTDIGRIGGDVPLIVDTTELITPEVAYEMLLHNTANRPIQWPKVEEYAAIMKAGHWKLHAQGIILDTHGNVLTGQKRLWAVIYAGVSVYMRVSRGNPPDTARVIDRGTPQTARDLATRGTGTKHTAVEASLARALLVLKGRVRPSTDELADMIEANTPRATVLLRMTAGTRKTRPILMVMAALCAPTVEASRAEALAAQITDLAAELEVALQPRAAAECWGRGVAFSLAMEHARRIVAR